MGILSKRISYPVKRFGSLIFIRLRIWWANVSTKAILPSLLWGAPVKIDFKLSLSALQAVSNELSEPTLPDCAEAMETDWPMRATHGISAALLGPWPNKSAWAAARTFGSADAWSTLLITPIVLVPYIKQTKNHFPSKRVFLPLKKAFIKLYWFFYKKKSTAYCRLTAYCIYLFIFTLPPSLY